jgi:transcriptional regulator with XRE-family HTH domain
MKKISYNSVFGAVIRRRRKKKGKPGAELAGHLDVTTGALSRLEAGRNAFSTTQILKVAQFLGCTPGTLFAEANKMAGRMQESGKFKVLVRGHPRDVSEAKKLGMVLLGTSVLIGIGMALIDDGADDPET